MLTIPAYRTRCQECKARERWLRSIRGPPEKTSARSLTARDTLHLSTVWRIAPEDSLERKHATPIVTEPVSETIHRIERFVLRMERRYECSSREMAERVRSGDSPETREVSKWLMEADALERLKAAAGLAVG